MTWSLYFFKANELHILNFTITLFLIIIMSLPIIKYLNIFLRGGLRFFQVKFHDSQPIYNKN